LFLLAAKNFITNQGVGETKSTKKIKKNPLDKNFGCGKENKNISIGNK